MPLGQRATPLLSNRRSVNHAREASARFDMIGTVPRVRACNKTSCVERCIHMVYHYQLDPTPSLLIKYCLYGVRPCRLVRLIIHPLVSQFMGEASIIRQTRRCHLPCVAPLSPLYPPVTRILAGSRREMSGRARAIGPSQRQKGLGCHCNNNDGRHGHLLTRFSSSPTCRQTRLREHAPSPPDRQQSPSSTSGPA